MPRTLSIRAAATLWLALAAGNLAALYALGQMYQRFEAPLVYIDALTGQCIKAVGPHGPVACDALPDIYDRVLVVKPRSTYDELGYEKRERF